MLKLAFLLFKAYENTDKLHKIVKGIITNYDSVVFHSNCLPLRADNESIDANHSSLIKATLQMMPSFGLFQKQKSVFFRVGGGLKT